jgi:hypothetical protein
MLKNGLETDVSLASAGRRSYVKPSVCVYQLKMDSIMGDSTSQTGQAGSVPLTSTDVTVSEDNADKNGEDVWK